MQMVKRLSATVVARLDRAIRGMENHDAVVGVSLADLQRAIAEARVRLQRVRAECGRQAQRRAELSERAQKWRDRARASAEDEATALECLRRARDCDQQAEDLADSEGCQRQAEQRLATAVERLEERHQALRAQREGLRSRQAAAEAGAVATRSEAGEDEQLAAILEDWEIEVTEAELAASGPATGDDLAERFDVAEERESLRAELASLRSETGED